MKKAQALTSLFVALRAADAAGAPQSKTVSSSSRSSLSLDQVSAKDEANPRYPVTKVVTLLTDMKKQLETEAETDETVYEKMKCWCEKNDKEKTQSVADAQARIAELTTLIETTAARSATLGQEIVNHEEELTKSKQSLEQATALREKQLAEFTAEEKDMLQSIQALKSAIIVLSKHHQASFLDTSLISGTIETIKYTMERHSTILLGSITPHQRRMVLAFGQQPYEPSSLRSYQPASGEIFGILKQMKETFETNLAETQKEESSNRQAYEELKAAKESEIQATQAALEEKRTRKAETDQKNADAKEEKEDLENSLSVDDKFLIDLKQRCASTETEYNSRVAMRNEEIQAVADAIKILNDDQARDTFSKVMNPASFMQRRARVQDHGSREKVAKMLAAAGKKVGSPELAALAITVRLDPMTRVKAAIDSLIQELKNEKQLEATKRDTCVSRTNENQRITEQYQRDVSDLSSRIEGHESTISESTDSLATIEKEIAEMQIQVKRKGEDRELENKEFQTTVADQREMQALLKRALDVLKRVYKASETVAAAPSQGQGQGQGSIALVQAHQEPPPEGFSTYGANRAHGGVLGLLEQIIADTKRMETQALADEQKAQEQYEMVVKDTNEAITAKQQQIMNLSGSKATAEQLHLSSKEELASKQQELETLANTASAIQLDCGFLMRNFEVRQQARDEEVEALQQAKAILSGMKAE